MCSRAPRAVHICCRKIALLVNGLLTNAAQHKGAPNSLLACVTSTTLLFRRGGALKTQLQSCRGSDFRRERRKDEGAGSACRASEDPPGSAYTAQLVRHGCAVGFERRRPFPWHHHVREWSERAVLQATTRDFSPCLCCPGKGCGRQGTRGDFAKRRHSSCPATGSALHRASEMSLRGEPVHQATDGTHVHKIALQPEASRIPYPVGVRPAAVLLKRDTRAAVAAGVPWTPFQFL